MLLYTRIVIVLTVAVSLVSCDIGKSPEKFFDEASEEIKKGKVTSAYKLLKKAAEKEPKNVKYSWAAASTAPNQNAAFIHTKAAWDNGLRNPLVLLKLAAVAFHTSKDQKLEYALNLYKELPDSSRSIEFRGDIFSQFLKFDSALAVYKAVEQTNPTPEIANKITFTLEKAGKPEAALEYLNQCRASKRMNSAAYSMLINLWALQYDYKQADLIYAEAVESGLANDLLKIDYAVILGSQNRFGDAKVIINEVLISPSAPAVGKLVVLLSQAYFSLIEKQYDFLNNEITVQDDTSKVADIANQYRLFLKERMKDTAGSVTKIAGIYKKVPQSAIVAISYARELVRTKQFGKADTLYRQIPQAILLSPSVLPEFASNLVRLGNDDDAMKLISNLHQHKIFNKMSLELFRDLSYKKNFIEKAEAAQKLLEKSFKDDAGVLWSKGMIALRSGKYDSAYSVFSSLASANPKETQFTIMMLNARFLKGDYEEVITDASSQNVPVAFGKLISARAYRKLDKIGDAKKTYEELLTIAKDTLFEPYMEYAQFLLESGDSKKAAETFSRLVTMYEKSPRKNDTGLAMILNNYAWSAAESESFDKEQVLAAAKKAITLQPDNAQIMDTYATVLMKSGMYKECVAALKDNALLKKNPSLLFHLGLAFEKSGDKNRAVRTYQEIVSTPDSLLGQNGNVKKAKLADHLAGLQK
ncbi:MAG: tetratricopeptide repeat protein [Fibrobacterota bacterium]